MQSRTPNSAALGAYWFGIQVVWGALLGVSLQARVSEVLPHDALAGYASLAGWGAAVAALTQILAGIVSDRRRSRGSRRVEFYIIGAAVASAALFWFYGASTFSSLLAAVIVLQIAMNLAIGPYQAAIPDFVAEDRLSSASSWMAGMQSLGNAAGALLAGLIANTRIVAGAIALALLAGCAVTVAHARGLALAAPDEHRATITRAHADLFISRALIYLGFYTLLGYMFFYLQPIGVNARLTAGITVLVVTASGALGALIAGRPRNTFDRRLLATLGGAVFALAVAALLALHALSGILVAAAAGGIGWGAFLSADWTLGCRLLPRALLATSMGVWNLALLIPQIAAPFIATQILGSLHLLHDPSAARVAFVVAIAEVSIGIAWIWRLPAPHYD